MFRFKRLAGLLILLFLLLPHTIFAASREEVLDIAKELHPPGCTDSMTANYCTLSTAYDLRVEIAEMLEAGKDKEQIIDELVQKYGKRILAAPQAQGFHWLAWLLPGTAILAGGALIGYGVSKWVRGTSANQKVRGSARIEEAISEDQEKQVQEELKQWL
jgi:cytochrome c-type biogenesis protein CcmH